MTKLISPCPYLQFFDDSANQLDGGKIYTYLTGSSTPAATYTTAAGGTLNGNPVVCDSNGQCSIWLDPNVIYRFVIMTADESETIDTIDGIVGGFDPNGQTYASASIKLQNNTGLLDSNGNKVFVIGGVTSAVNYFKATNSATGDPVLLEAQGSDSNIDINLNTKGTGQFYVNGVQIGGTFARDYKAGMTLSNNSVDTQYSVDISAGTRTDSTELFTISQDGSFTKAINSGWVAGTDEGGMATGVALIASTWYHVFAIRDSGNTCDYGFDSSLTAANLLSTSGYTYYRRIGSVYVNSGGTIDQISQYGSEVLWKTIVTSYSTAAPGTSAVSVTVRTPLGVKTQAILAAKIYDSSAGTPSAVNMLVTSPDQTDTAATISNSQIGIRAQASPDTSLASSQMNIRTGTSSNIRFRVDVSSANITPYIITYGYIDPDAA